MPQLNLFAVPTETGVVTAKPLGAEIVVKLRSAGFIVNAARPDVLRLAPPLIISADQVDALLAALPAALDGAEQLS